MRARYHGLIRVPRYSLLVVVAFAACTAPKRSSTIPDPQGKTLEEYLADEPQVAKPELPEQGAGDTMTYHFIDVGQGTAILLEFPCGAVLVDTGGEENDEYDSKKALFDYLEAFFDRRKDLKRTLAGLVITHPHIDHDRWVIDVLDTYPVSNVVDNGRERNDMGGRPQIAMHKWLHELGYSVPYQAVLEVDIKPPDGLTSPVIDPIGACDASPIDPEIRALWGQETEDVETFGDNPNNHSIALRVDFGEASALLVADMEIQAQARMSKKFESNPSILDVDIYQVGHHGSKNATVQHMMKSMTPEIAVIPAGPYDRIEDWSARRYGHPNKKAIDLLRDPLYGVSGKRVEPIEAWVGIKGAWKDRPEVFEKETITKAIYCTGWDGDVRVVAGASGAIEVETSR